MNVLVACEYSGRVREAFRKKGHRAWSCDLLPTEQGIHHFQADVFSILNKFSWDLMIAHPPCTALCVSGNRWYANTQDRIDAIHFVERLWNCGIPKVCIENPVGVLSTQSMLGKATQYIQPWQFGHGETKKTGLWLDGLAPLQPTNIVNGRDNRIHRMAPSKDRGKLRSLTYQGIADAMADQWG